MAKQTVQIYTVCRPVASPVKHGEGNDACMYKNENAVFKCMRADLINTWKLNTDADQKNY